jgi:hypothetical protein
MDNVRYLNKNNNANERNNYSLWWKEQIEHYGVNTIYYTNGYSISAHDFLYGEEPTATYLSAGNVIMMTDITNDSILLSKFGIMADCDMTAVIHISSYYDTFGFGAEPKAGDLIELKEYGGFGDRPGGRGAPIYEITERDDEYLPLTNHLMGHYVWYIKCKRWEYSYEPGVHAEPGSTQISDGGEYGAETIPLDPCDLTSTVPIDLANPIPQNADDEAKKIFDYGDLSSPYGNY